MSGLHPLGPEEVHVWIADLRPSASKPATDRESRTDAVRAGEFLRSVLATYVGGASDELLLETDVRGKPRLRGRDLEFNLTHSGALAALAVSARTPVGIDVETIRTPRDPLALARRFFAPEEARELGCISPDRRNRAFLTAWTRKEAFVKGVGVGLSGHLGRFRVSCDPDRPARLLAVDWNPRLASAWHLRDLDLAGGVVGALAVGSPREVRVTIQTWPIDQAS